MTVEPSQWEDVNPDFQGMSLVPWEAGTPAEHCQLLRSALTSFWDIPRSPLPGAGHPAGVFGPQNIIKKPSRVVAHLARPACVSRTHVRSSPLISQVRRISAKTSLGWRGGCSLPICEHSLRGPVKGSTSGAEHGGGSLGLPVFESSA